LLAAADDFQSKKQTNFSFFFANKQTHKQQLLAAADDFAGCKYQIANIRLQISDCKYLVLQISDS
jgi:hypothetical protein